MAKKMFGKELIGFNRKDVTGFIDKIVKEYEVMIREKEDENRRLRSLKDELIRENAELKGKLYELESSKERIASVLIKANEKAEIILEDAKKQAVIEKREVENQLEKERMKLTGIKNVITEFKGEIVKFSKGFEHKVDDFAQSAEGYIKNSIARDKQMKIVFR